MLVRRSDSAAYKGPADFDCEHGNVLYVYQEAENQLARPLKRSQVGRERTHKGFLKRYKNWSV